MACDGIGWNKQSKMKNSLFEFSVATLAIENVKIKWEIFCGGKKNCAVIRYTTTIHVYKRAQSNCTMRRLTIFPNDQNLLQRDVCRYCENKSNAQKKSVRATNVYDVVLAFVYTQYYIGYLCFVLLCSIQITHILGSLNEFIVSNSDVFGFFYEN